MKRILKTGLLIFLIAIVASTVYAMRNIDSLGATQEGKLASVIGITSEETAPIISVFESVGLGEFQIFVHDELLDNAHFDGEKGYRLTTKDAANIIVYLNNDNTVYLIKYADNILYSENEAKANLKDYILTLVDKSRLQTQSEEAIKKLLKAPSTAKFPNINSWNMWIEGETTIIQGYVDAQNGFGALIRSDFQFKIKNNTVTSLIFDGKEYIN